MLVPNSVLAWVYMAAVAFLSFFGAWVGNGLRAYGVKRAELRAKEERLGVMTRLEESVRHDFHLKLEAFRNDQTRAIEEFRAQQTRDMEQFKAGQTHRFLAAEKRLQACQEAFTHWRKVLAAIHQPDFLTTVEAATAWWNSNCLYIDSPARHRFIDGMNAIHGHQTLFNSDYDGDLDARRAAEVTKQRLMDRFVDIAPALFEAAKVPELAGDELAAMKDVASLFEKDYAE